MADVITPASPKGERWTLDELRGLLGGEPTIERFARGYTLAFVTDSTGPDNVAVAFATHGERTVRGAAVIMHMDQAPSEWWNEYSGGEP